MKTKKYLNLGCGSDIKESYSDIEWINIDFNNPLAMNLDLRKPLPFYMNSIDFIYTSHLVEHFTKYEWAGIIKDWYRALKWDGILEIHCPDLEQACKMFLVGENRYHGIVPIHDMIYGSQENEGQRHCQGFDKIRIKSELINEGFREVDVYNTTNENDWELTAIAKK